MPLTPELLLQRQIEASGSFREAVRSSSQLIEAKSTISELAQFMPTVQELARVLQIPLENVFQCLMQIGMGGGSMGFDQQARKGIVPMHQAKVLDRQSLLEAQKVEPTLRKQVPKDELERLVANCQTLRHFLRMKVEDHNDFRMAHMMVDLTNEYLGEIHRLAEGDERLMFALYNAQSTEDIIRLTNGRAVETCEDGADLLGSTVKSLSATTKPVPRNLIAGMQSELALMRTGKEPVAQRQAALTTIVDWLQRIDKGLMEESFEEILNTLHAPIRLHLSEKRSGVVRLAASAVSMMAVRSPPHMLLDGPRQSSKSRAVFGAWLDTLFKSVFVTVAAIADTADETVRDIIVATGGAAFTMARVAEALRNATQSALKRKLLNYVAVGLLAMPPASSPYSAETNSHVQQLCQQELSTLSFLLTPLIQGSDAGVRKAARSVAIIAQEIVPSHLSEALLKGSFSSSSSSTSSLHATLCGDATVAKAIAADRESVVGKAREGMEAFELECLGCSQPCTASLFWHERCGVLPTNSCAKQERGEQAKNKGNVTPKGRVKADNEQATASQKSYCEGIVEERANKVEIDQQPPQRQHHRASAHDLKQRRDAAKNDKPRDSISQQCTPPSTVVVASLRSPSPRSGLEGSFGPSAASALSPPAGPPPTISCALLHRKRSLSNSLLSGGGRLSPVGQGSGVPPSTASSQIAMPASLALGVRANSIVGQTSSPGWNMNAGQRGLGGSFLSSSSSSANRMAPDVHTQQVDADDEKGGPLLAPSDKDSRSSSSYSLHQQTSSNSMPLPSSSSSPLPSSSGLLPSIYATNPARLARQRSSASMAPPLPAKQHGHANENEAPSGPNRFSNTSPSIAGAMPLSLGLGHTRSRSRPQL